MSDFGWWFPPGSRKAHYCLEGEYRALCQRWGFLGQPATGIFEPDAGPSPDDCKACRSKLDRRAAR